MLKFVMAALMAAISFSHAQTPNEAHFLDRMIAFYQEANTAAQMAQEKSSHLNVKKMARKMERENNRQLRKLRRWRESYYESVPERWLLPSEEIMGLKEIPPGNFDLEFLERMTEHLKEGKKIVRKMQGRRTKNFIQTFMEKSFKEINQRLEMMQELREELLGVTS